MLGGKHYSILICCISSEVRLLRKELKTARKLFF